MLSASGSSVARARLSTRVSSLATIPVPFVGRGTRFLLSPPRGVGPTLKKKKKKGWVGRACALPQQGPLASVFSYASRGYSRSYARASIRVDLWGNELVERERRPSPPRDAREEARRRAAPAEDEDAVHLGRGFFSRVDARGRRRRRRGDPNRTTDRYRSSPARWSRWRRRARSRRARR